MLILKGNFIAFSKRLNNKKKDIKVILKFLKYKLFIKYIFEKNLYLIYIFYIIESKKNNKL